MDFDTAIDIAEKQEALLQFLHFSRKDVWDLGNVIVSEIFDKKYVLATSIRLINGLIAFQYIPEGTNLNNNFYLTRKFNLVRDKENSSLLTTLRWQKKDEGLAYQGLSPAEYVLCGGGFPIVVKGTGIVAVALVSGLPHLQDHDILVETISRYLGVSGVPRIPLDAGL
ncbi:heme-binding protein [Treponema primitia]|uniref:heme-binding protein n=1 Tax=Treponema primitia TaxID=88058 RepID=UPI0002555046|nr:heme-binding protein [Treponema primitia]